MVPGPAIATARPAGIGPILPVQRVASIDVLRGVAVLGILLMNVVSMGLPFAAYDDPTIAGNRSAADFWSWAVFSVLAEGKLRAIFSMLFGAGVVLLTARVEARGAGVAAADVHMRRNLWLVLFGAVHSYLLLWPGEVLFTYGVVGVPLYAFRRLRPRALLVLGVTLLVLQVPQRIVENQDLADASSGLRSLASVTASGRVLTAEERRSRDRWQETMSRAKPTPAMLEQAVATKRSGYLANFRESAAASAYLESTHLYEAGFWDAASMMLIGMALLELGILSASRSRRFYIAMALVSYAIGLPVAIWIVADWTRHGFEPGLRWTSLDDVSRLSVALGHVAVVMLVCKAAAGRWAAGLLAPVGRMALTNYILQTVICVTLFGGFGFGWFGQLARHQLYYVVGTVWSVQVIVSTRWLRRFRFGPLEWVWRSLTYQRRQPLRIQQ